MAFTSLNFGAIGPTSTLSIPRMWAYAHDSDNVTAIKASGYFDDLSDRLHVGDTILLNCLDDAATPASRVNSTYLMRVAGVTTAGVVTTSVGAKIDAT